MCEDDPLWYSAIESVILQKQHNCLQTARFRTYVHILYSIHNCFKWLVSNVDQCERPEKCSMTRNGLATLFLPPLKLTNVCV